MNVCPYFKVCGGCDFQDLGYEIQISRKRFFLSKLLGVSEEVISVFYDNPYNYRNRMDFIFHVNGLGLRKRGDWSKIVDVDYCNIADERINNLLKEVRDFFKNPDYFDVKNHSGTLRYAVIRVANESSISFVLNSESSRISFAVNKIKEFSRNSNVNNVVVTFVKPDTDVSVSNDFFVVKGSDKLSIDLMNKKFFFSVQGFFQNNTLMAEKMHFYINDLIRKSDLNTKDVVLLDLYSGVGTFGIINSDLFKKVFLVELDKNSFNSSLENIKFNNAFNVSAFNLDCSKIKKIPLKNNEDFFIIMDPPRSGVNNKTLIALKELKPRKIIYVSCNPKELLRDIKKLKEYKTKSIAFFDFFPQTKHMEVIVELERKIL
ncbi:MAG: 23S rRNA (uracil(1939)-C(5))-methyltransferase RlmD [Candidatus Woesearchaeota archaeon]